MVENKINQVSYFAVLNKYKKFVTWLTPLVKSDLFNFLSGVVVKVAESLQDRSEYYISI